jgi:class 3 adenylate cyclase
LNTAGNSSRGLRRELADPKIQEHRGRIVKTTGDGLLVEFASVVDDVLRCAVGCSEGWPLDLRSRP